MSVAHAPSNLLTFYSHVILWHSCVLVYTDPDVTSHLQDVGADEESRASFPDQLESMSDNNTGERLEYSSAHNEVPDPAVMPKGLVDSMSRSDMLLWMVDELAALPPSERISVMKHLEDVLDAEIYENVAYTNPVYVGEMLSGEEDSRTVASDLEQPCANESSCLVNADSSHDNTRQSQVGNKTHKKGRKRKPKKRRPKQNRKPRDIDSADVDRFCDSPGCTSSGEDYVDIDVTVYKDQNASRLLPEEVECPDPENIIEDLFYSSNKVALGSPMRALRTIPERWLSINESSIPDAGRGVFANTFIPAYTWLGEYQGEIVPDSDDNKNRDHTYTWMVTKVHVISYNIDAYDESVSNWLRYVNTPRHVTEENVHVRSCYGRIMYMTSRHLVPGQELLVYYGEAYMENLGIDMDNYLKEKEID